MIEVTTHRYAVDKPEVQIILVDAATATLIAGTSGTDSTLLVLEDANGVEVAWFSNWDSAVVVDNLMEYPDEQ